ncbi:MAG: DUF11 domain-containing protein [Desulfatibacillum sp.]|nr:DUF11 domain-containing protein [Desulfatibacillum sp.]
MLNRCLYISIFTVALAFLLFSSPAFAGWAVNGDAFWVDLPGDSEQVTLTPELNDQAGSAWIETQIDLAQDFDISFRIYLGDIDSGGADGISFALHKDPAGTAAFGDTSGGGEWIGMNGICPSVSVEVDTWQNTGRGDPTYDHVGINVYTPSGTTCSGYPNHSGAGPIQADPGSTNVEDGDEHVLRITWDTSSNQLVVYFDNSYRLQYTDDIINNVFSGDSMVYFGFAASTGGAYNLQYIIPNTPDVAAEKTVDQPLFLKTDLPATIEYTIDIENNGDVTGFGTQITDTLPANFTYINNSTSGGTTVNPSISYSGGRQVLQWDMSATPIPPDGGSMSITFEVTISSSVVPGSFPNDFTVSGDNFAPINQTEMAEVVIGPADLEVDKAHTGDYYVGQNGTFTLDVYNNGPDYCENIIIEDTLPAGLDYVGISGTGWSLLSSSGQTYRWTHAGPLNNGASLPTLTVTVFVNDTSGAAYPSITNSATVSSDAPDLVPGNDSDSDTVTVHALADLSITKSHSGDFGVGSNGTYDIGVTNNGPNEDPAATITVTDTLPAGLTYVSFGGTGWSLASSSGQTYTFTHAGALASGASLPVLSVTVLAGAGAVGTVTNTAVVSSATNDDDLTNNTATDPTTVLPTVDLSITKSHTGASFAIGDNVTFDIAIANNGPNDDSGPISVMDTLPTGLTYVSLSGAGWSLAASSGQDYTFTHAGPLNNGGSLATLSVTASVAAGAYPTATNTATVYTTNHDPNSANSQDTDTITVAPLVDLSVSKSHTGNFSVGAAGTYSIDVANTGATADPGPIYAADTLPAGFNYTSVSGTGWSLYSTSGQTYTFVHSGPLATGATLPTLSVSVTPASGTIGTFINTVTVSSSSTDGDSGNNTATDPTTVTDNVDLAINKSHSGDFTVSSNGTFSITVSNLSANAEPGPIYVVDTFPTGLTYTGFSGTDWSLASSSGQEYTFVHAGPLAGENTLDTLNVEVFVQPEAYSSATNSAAVSGIGTDIALTNNSATDTVTVVRPSSGNKPIYFREYSSSYSLLSRDSDAYSDSSEEIDGGSDSNTWFLYPYLELPITIPANVDNIVVYLVLDENGRGSRRYINIRIWDYYGFFDEDIDQTVDISGRQQYSFSIPIGSSAMTLPAGDSIYVQVTNETNQVDRTIIVYSDDGSSNPGLSNRSYVDLVSETVISIDNLDTYDATYSGGAIETTFDASVPDTVYVRAEISDPFGSFDITEAAIDIIDSESTYQITSGSMTEVYDSGDATKIYEYAFTLNSTMPTGLWTARVTAVEGTEGLVTDVGTTQFTVVIPPDFTVLKTAQTVYDPYNNTTNPKAIPGAYVMYSVLVTNFGGASDADSFIMTDPIDSNIELFVGDLSGAGSGPVQFSCSTGAPPCGLTYTFTSLASTTDDLDFSQYTTGTDFSYVPVGDAEGFDDVVRRLRVNPKNSFSAAGVDNPYCTIYFKVRVK